MTLTHLFAYFCYCENFRTSSFLIKIPSNFFFFFWNKLSRIFGTSLQGVKAWKRGTKDLLKFYLIWQFPLKDIEELWLSWFYHHNADIIWNKKPHPWLQWTDPSPAAYILVSKNTCCNIPFQDWKTILNLNSNSLYSIHTNQVEKG